MRVKAKCSKCTKTILLLFFEEDPDAQGIGQLEKGEYVEHKCPACGEWAAFEVLE